MKGRTYSIWQRGCSSLCLSMIVAFGGGNLATAQTVAAPQPTKPNIILAAKPQYIAQNIAALKQSQRRWIEIDLKKQQLIAWEGDSAVYRATISSGKRSTPTLVGTFAIQSKVRLMRMRGPGYSVPNVPYAMFYDGNYGIHGAYWHNKFGTPVSHGCVNLKPQQARWLYNWASVGTHVVVRK